MSEQIVPHPPRLQRGLTMAYSKNPTELKAVTWDQTSELRNRRPGAEVGYPGLSAVMNMENDLMLFRRFGALSVRSLLYMQDEIAALEERLRAEDVKQKESGVDLGDRKLDSPEKVQIMKEIRPLLKEYMDYVGAVAQMRSFDVSPDTQQELRHWLREWRPLVDEDQSFIEKEKDIIALSTMERSFVARFANNHPSLLRVLFRKKVKSPPEGIPQDQDLVFFEARTAARSATVLVGLIFLLLPMLVLQLSLDNKSASVRAGFTAAFIVIFSLLMSAFTPAKSSEILTATAGYAAVLVVFMAQSATPQSLTPGAVTNSTTPGA